MKMSSEEMMKIFDFILENRSIIIGGNGLFSRDTLMMIRAIVKGKITNNFELTQEQKQLLIDAFIESNNYFTDDTPEFILENEACINASIERNINSANFIKLKDLTPELSQKIINIAINKKYILTLYSPEFLRSNYEVALNSIRQDANSANYVSWFAIEKDATKKDVIDDLIQETIKAGYELSQNSCRFLITEPDIILNSIKKDINTIKYSSAEAKNNPKIFKYLMLNGYKFSEVELKNAPLSNFKDKDAMRYAMEKLSILDKCNYDFRKILIFKDYSDDDIDKYAERYIELYAKAINTPPTIKGFNAVLQVCVESEWNEHREENLDDYANIFGKICTELKNNDSYSDAIDKLYFLNKMNYALGSKYNLLLQAMEQYHTIIHNNQKCNIDSARDQIAKLSALYVSISKEKFKKERLDQYYGDIKDYFIPRKTHSIVYKKIIEHKYKRAFRILYDDEDGKLREFIESIVKQYSQNLDEDTIRNMISNFVTYNNSKMDSFIKAPRGWNNYKRYKEASKLINRLNSHYIKYTDLELVGYLDIIKYNIEKDKYYYDGPSFEEESITRYNEYKKKLEIFDKIKQQIIFKAKKLEIDNKISYDELMNIAEDLPFNDEYFEFDKCNNNFSLNDFINGCIYTNINDFIEPSSLINDEAYSILTNYIINNGLFWMLLILNNFTRSLDECDINKNAVLETFDYMEDVAILAKKLNYDVNKYENVLTLCELSECADTTSIAILGEDVISKLCRYRDYTNDDAEKIVKMATELVCWMAKRNKSTVPYIKGTYGNYKYSMYDSQDETILLAGINTDACFRIDGNDNDFLHYCALDKNGFVIKITDTFDNFIGRGSGFRNGNCVFINQLRTIYDQGGNNYYGKYENEQNDIIETFKKACEDIVSTSHKNSNEKDKIDYVFVTKSYSLSNYDSNVSYDVESKIGVNPMDNESEDWKDFVNNTNNLNESERCGYFHTDYANYELICMASYKKNKILKDKDIKPKNVEALYDRPRNKVIVTTEINSQIFEKINKINGMKSFFEYSKFESVDIPKYSTVFMGDNWYIVFKDGNIISSFVLDFDHKAKVEFSVTKDAIEQHVLNGGQQLNIDQVVENLQSQNFNDDVKVLKLNF